MPSVTAQVMAVSDYETLRFCFAFAQNSRDEVRVFSGHGQVVGALFASPGMKQTCYLCFVNAPGGNSGDRHE